MILGGNNKPVVWSAACPISDLFGKGDRYWAQLTLCPISALPCQINQISDSSQPNNCIRYAIFLLIAGLELELWLVKQGVFSSITPGTERPEEFELYY